MKVEITNWAAKADVLEIAVRIDPFMVYTRYHRVNENYPNSYSARWFWKHGTKEAPAGTSGQELSDILDDLVLNHSELISFAKLYNIYKEEEVS